MMSPENIDAGIQRIHGNHTRVSNEKAEKVFKDVRVAFDDFATEFSESETVRDQNLYIANEVHAEAEKQYNYLRQNMPVDKQNAGSLSTAANMAFRTAVVPYVMQIMRHFMVENQEQKKIIDNFTAAPKVTQTSEPISKPRFDLGKTADQIGSLNDIARKTMTKF